MICPSCGWRITSAPEPAPQTSGYTADDPASAQAVPATEAGRALLAGEATRQLFHVIDGRRDALTVRIIAIEQAAVRAALEGLRAQVAELSTQAEDAVFVSAVALIVGYIDTRLAAQPLVPPPAEVERYASERRARIVSIVLAALDGQYEYGRERAAKEWAGRLSDALARERDHKEEIAHLKEQLR